MLILTRRVNGGDHSVILIGHDIEVTITEIRGDQARIGIQVPREITVHRTELYNQIVAEIEANSSPQK